MKISSEYRQIKKAAAERDAAPHEMAAHYAARLAAAPADKYLDKRMMYRLFLLSSARLDNK